MKKKLGLSLGILLLGGLVWYLFVKPYDYLVTFKAKTSPGTINQTIKLWTDKETNAELIAQEGLSHLKHNIRFNDSIFVFDWNIEYLNDSISQVKVYVSNLGNSLLNKITIPFSETDFEKRTKNTLTNVLEKLREHTKLFKVTVVGNSVIPDTYCAYIPLSSSQFGKANKMMENYSILSELMSNGDVKPNGRPFIQVNHWYIEKDSISFDFCYPIIQTDTLPEHKIIKYRQFKGGNALKAIYNGNYITSDRAWYVLLDHAQKNNIKVEKQPVEIFHSNPNLGGDELTWKAEIYMPLKK